MGASKRPLKNSTQQDTEKLDGIRRAALGIAVQRAEHLRTIKQSLVAGFDGEALSLMRQFFGLTGGANEDAQNTRR